jgi:ribonuclease D
MYVYDSYALLKSFYTLALLPPNGHFFDAPVKKLLDLKSKMRNTPIAMTVITDTKTLEDYCNSLSSCEFLTMDTEFLRDRTYYPRLCLIQMAGPGIEAAAIDPLEKSLSLEPLFELLGNENLVKVFHAARQDLEIFYGLTKKIPAPLFDTQVAAMVCGYGESISYLNLVNDICGQKLDKGAQFTDWSRRPLTNKQLSYALDDVTYLRDVYLSLSRELEKRGRTRWVKGEMEVLTSPDTYKNPPYDAWLRLKVKSNKPKVLSVLREIAAWREIEAQSRNVPRNRVMRDETLLDMAVHAPKKRNELQSIRNIPKNLTHGDSSQELLAAIQKGLDVRDDECPRPPKKARFPSEMTPVLEMLKMLLKIKASENKVAMKLIASNKDLEVLAQHKNPDIPALRGWRYEVFGEDALKLKEGKLALTINNKKISRLKLHNDEQ